MNNRTRLTPELGDEILAHVRSLPDSCVADVASDVDRAVDEILAGDLDEVLREETSEAARYGLDQLRQAQAKVDLAVAYVEAEVGHDSR